MVAVVVEREPAWNLVVLWSGVWIGDDGILLVLVELRREIHDAVEMCLLVGCQHIDEHGRNPSVLAERLIGLTGKDMGFARATDVHCLIDGRQVHARIAVDGIVAIGRECKLVGAVAGGEQLLMAAVKAHLIIIGISRIGTFLLTVTEEDERPAYSINALNTVGNEVITFSETPFQLSVTVVEIPVATPCALAPPKDLLTMVEEMIVKETDVEMGLAHLADDKRDLTRGNVNLTEVERVNATAAPRIEQPVVSVCITEFDVGVFERTDRQELAFAGVGIVPEEPKLTDVLLIGQRHLLRPKDGAVAAEPVDDIQVADFGVVLYKVEIHMTVPSSGCITFLHAAFRRTITVRAEVATIGRDLLHLARTIVSHVEVVGIAEHGVERVGGIGMRLVPMIRLALLLFPCRIDSQLTCLAVVDIMLAAVAPKELLRVAATKTKTVKAQRAGSKRRVASQFACLTDKGVGIREQRLFLSRCCIHKIIFTILAVG